jgi:hypothetical protein
VVVSGLTIATYVCLNYPYLLMRFVWGYDSSPRYLHWPSPDYIFLASLAGIVALIATLRQRDALMRVPFITGLWLLGGYSVLMFLAWIGNRENPASFFRNLSNFALEIGIFSFLSTLVAVGIVTPLKRRGAFET